MIDLVVAALLYVAMTVPENSPVPHEDEIAAFANLAALAEVASDQCTDILINQSLMADLHERMHIRPMDDPAVFDVARKTKDAVRKAASQAASPQAWCDSVYRLYGPDGTILRDLMRR